MKNKVYITGATGFIGTNLIKQYSNLYDFRTYVRGGHLDINDAKVVIHLAGKAHDVKNKSILAEYIEANYALTKMLFDAFVESSAETFIMFSSVKAAADRVEGELTEDVAAQPISDYGKSKLMAERYILKKLPHLGEKRVYILRPCMVHGPGNKGNLNLLYSIVSKGVPWPLGAFANKRSFCSIENLCFVIKEIIEREYIESGIYNVSDDTPVSTNELVKLIAEVLDINVRIWRISPKLIKTMALIGDYIAFPINSERLQKLTETYMVSNDKLTRALGTRLPVSSYEGLRKTILSFKEQ